MEIAVGSKGNPIYIVNGRIDRQRTKVVVTSDEQGRFAFPAIEGQYTLVAMNDSGYTITRWDNFHFNRAITLGAFATWQPNMRFPMGKVNMLTFGKGGQEALDGYFIDIAYHWEADETAKSRIIEGWSSQNGDNISLQVPLR